MAAIFFKSLLVGYSGAVMPGSLLTYVINQSLKKGMKTGYLAIIGHAILEILLITLIFLGLNKIFTSTITSIVISFLGGILLLFFGISGIIEIFKKGMEIKINQQESMLSDSRVILDGILLSGSNPYFVIWWATIGIVLLYEAYNLFGYLGVVVFTVGHLLADLSWYVFVSGMIAKSKGFLPQKSYKIIAFVLSLALVGFGAKYLVNGVTLLLSVI